MTQRWRNDPVEKSIDPNHDPNVFSFYYYSRLDIHLAGGKSFHCEDMRAGCPGMVARVVPGRTYIVSGTGCARSARDPGDRR